MISIRMKAVSSHGLGSEGRSTSTTTMAFSILKALREGGLDTKDQKLLSFTDSRQDAALQAGHFNDFISVVRLRAGIRKALETAADGGLDYTTLGGGDLQCALTAFP